MTITIPQGFDEIGPADHPRDGGSGTLLRNRATGVYALWDGRTTRRVPHKWAQDVAADMGKTNDWIQDACIARARELGLTAYAVAKATKGAVSEDHVKDFLERRKSMGSHKLQHVLAALDHGDGLRWLAAAVG